MKKTFADILNDFTEADLSRMRKKVPEWGEVEGMEYPSRLCMEQCSSAETARYKASFCQRIANSRGLDEFKIADLTGGLGVDCWAFSSIATHIHHNEMNLELSSAVQRNFARLGICNASFSNIEIVPGSIASLFDEGQRPDIIFLDPARRGAGGKKVFLLEDCSPDVLTLKDELFQTSHDLLLKLSPMADISMVCSRLGKQVREIHSVAADGECKELLVWLQKDWDNGFTITVGSISFIPEDEKAAVPVFFRNAEDLSSCPYLFEPSSALLKAGAFNLICQRFGIVKYGRFTHIYGAEEIVPELKELGKWFRVNGVRDFSKRDISETGKAYPRCELSARNVPMTSDELRKRMGAASGSDTHIFAVTADFMEAPSVRRIIVTERV